MTGEQLAAKRRRDSVRAYKKAIDHGDAFEAQRLFEGIAYQDFVADAVKKASTDMTAYLEWRHSENPFGVAVG